MLDSTSYRQGLGRFIRFRWLASAGALVASALAYTQLRKTGFLAAGVVAVLIAVSNLGHIALARTRVPLRLLLMTQFFADLVLLTAYLGCAGYPGPLVLLYLFHVVLAALILERRDAFLVFAVAVALAAAVTWLWYADVLFPGHPPGFFALLFPPGWSPGLTGMKLRFPAVFAAVTAVVLLLILPLVEDARARARRLREAEQRAVEHAKGMERILNGTGAGLMVLDESHQLRWINQIAADWFPRCAAGERRECYSSIASPPSAGPAICATCQVLQESGPWGGEYTVPTPEGDPRTFRVYAAPIVEPDGTRLVAEVVFDVSVERETERRLIEARRYETVSHFAAGVAHELGTPLASVAAGLGLVTKRLRAAGDEPSRSLLELIAELAAQTRRCHRLIDSFLGYSRQLRSRLETVVIQEIIDKACAGLRADRDLDGVEIQMAGSSDDVSKAPPAVCCDREHLQIVLANVLTNAVDGIRAAGRERGLIQIRTSPRGETVEVRILDNGTGIPPDLHASVFEPFFTTKKDGEGTGLGLPVARGLLDGMGGTISIGPDPNQSEIVIRLQAGPVESRGGSSSA